jgi:hypothetical protein
MMKVTALVLLSLLLATIIGCSSQSGSVAELRRFPMDSLEGLISRSNIELDTQNSTDGNGSVRIAADEPSVIRLFEVEGLDIDETMLIYQAHLRTEDVDGQVYLEMWCDFPGMGEFFSRGLRSPLSGSNNWTTAATPFLLKKGQRPQRVRLNLVIDGTGTAWIDDVRLLTSSLS